MAPPRPHASLLLSLIAALGTPGVAQEAFPPLPDRMPTSSQKVVHYRIEATLQEDGATIDGVVHLRWRNPASEATQELRWHVYNNAWAGPDSQWFHEARLYGDESEPRGWGHTEIHRVATAGDSPQDLEWAWVPQPDAPEDRTVLRVVLPNPVAPGAETALSVAFTAQLPPAFRRSGTDGQGGYIHAAQWFPKIGVYEDRDGRAQWNCEPYHYLTEFYADYGDYVVTLTLPERYADRVAASGSLADATTLERSHQVRYRFEAEDVHDFAWSADPDFVVIRKDFDPTAWSDSGEERRVANALGRSIASVRPQPTKILLYLQPEHRSLEGRYLTALSKAIYYFGLWYGSYPYPTISLVDPANDARGTGGMEYPRLITAGARLGTLPSTLSPEGVTIHEFGHQFWYGLVGNDEFRDAWLDEGFNTYSTSRVEHIAYPPPRATYRLFGREHLGRPAGREPSYGPGDARALLTLQRWESPDLRLLPPLSVELRHATALDRWLRELPPVSAWPDVENDPIENLRFQHEADWSDPIATPTFGLLNPRMRRVNAYYRPAMTLECCASLMGETRWTRLMRAWQERWRFRHPHPADFLAILQEFGAGAKVGEVPVDWAAFWRQAYAENRLLDYAVDRIANQPSPAKQDSPAARTWDCVLELRRRGDFRLPVLVRVHWDDGTSEDLSWDGQDPWKRWRWPSSHRKLLRAEIDPDRHVLLDRDWLNDSRSVTPDRHRAFRAGLRAMIWAQQVLHYAGGMG